MHESLLNRSIELVRQRHREMDCPVTASLPVETLEFIVIDLADRLATALATDDEPVITFRARDRHALALLLHYATLVGDSHHRQAVADRIDEFGRWRDLHPQAMKEDWGSRGTTPSTPKEANNAE